MTRQSTRKLLALTAFAPKTAWAALIQDYEAYESAERGIKVFIKAAVNNTWIRDLRNPKTFYSNVTAFAIFDYLCKQFGSLHVLDTMVSLTIQISQYYKGTPDIPKYNNNNNSKNYMGLSNLT
jgi:hypothetical protein